MRITRTLLISLVAPGLAFLLLAVQVAYGLRGFDDPRGGIVAVLEVPGMLVGWGALAFLLPLLAALLLDWWGISATGIAARLLGGSVLALACGGVFGVLGGVALGGHVGGSLAALLVETVGSGMAVALLSLMALAGGVLTFSGLRDMLGARPGSAGPKNARTTSQRASSQQGAGKPAAEAGPGVWARLVGGWRKLFKPKKRVSDLTDLMRGGSQPERDSSKPWYPDAQYDDQGNELPMDFGRDRDVGTIRYTDVSAEDEAAPESVPAAADTDEPARTLPTIPELFAGNEEELADAVLRDPPTSDDDAPADEAPSAEDDASEGRLHVDGVRGYRVNPAASSSRASLGRVVGTRTDADDEQLMPGVRWAEPTPPPVPSALDPDVDEDEGEDEVLDDEAAEVMEAPEADLPPPPRLSDEARDLGAVLGRRPSAPDPDEREDTPTVRDSVRQALGGETPNRSSRRYMEKLEASGIFDFMQDGEEETAPPKAGRKKAARKKSARKKAARKKAARKKSTAAKGSRKASARKKTAAKKKTSRKSTARKNATSRPAPKGQGPRTKRAPKTPPASTGTATQAPAAAPRPWKGGAWTASGGTDPQAHALDAESAARLRVALRDPEVRRAADLAAHRGTASAILLTRRLGLALDRARDVCARLEHAGLLGPAGPRGAHPATLDAAGLETYLPDA